MKSSGRNNNGVFMAAYGLLVQPNMNDVDAGLCEAPYINHNEIDFESLAVSLSEVLSIGSGHVLRVAGDTIDQVTFAARSGSLPGHQDERDPACSDFGEAILKLAKGSTGSVIDVRKAWDHLHYMSNRYTEAPPPMMIVFVVSSPDFYDAMSWASNANMMLGRDLVSEYMDDNEDGGMHTGEEGVLPTLLKTEFERIFGWPFEGNATLMRIASDNPPTR